MADRQEAEDEGMGIQPPGLTDEGEGLGKRDRLEYAMVLEKKAEEQRSGLHGDLRQQMNKRRTGRGVRLTRMMEPASAAPGMRQRGCSPVDCAQEEEGWGS